MDQQKYLKLIKRTINLSNKNIFVTFLILIRGLCGATAHGCDGNATVVGSIPTIGSA